MRNISLGLISGIVVLSFACKHSKDNLKDEISFRIDNTALGETFTDSVSKISIRIPKDWESIEEKSDSVSTRIKKQLWAKDQISPVKKIYLDQKTFLSSLSILKVDRKDSIRVLKSYQNPDSAFYNKGQWKSINKAEFNYHGLKIKQFILFNDNLVNIKLICSKMNSIEFDFLLTQEEYKKNIKKIESSIGSINAEN